MPQPRAREGDFLQTSDGLLFDVKGLLHPPDRIVAYLRYYPDGRGRRSRNGIRYVKVYDLARRRLLLEKKWPCYLYHDKIEGRELQGVPKDSILAVHAPQQRMAALLRSKQKDRLEGSATRLVKALAKESGLPIGHFGVSGSLLVGLHRDRSDLDVMVYGFECAKRVQRALCSLLEEDRTFQAYRRSDLRKLFIRRHLQQAMAFRDFELQERRKSFQGIFEGHDYFIRCVKNWKEITERYGEARFRHIGEYEVSGQVVDDNENLLTPCRYVLERVRVLKGDPSRSPIEIVSFRGRFTEQAYQGELVLARGRLEAVRTKDQKYFRLVVGEGLADVLQTIW